MNLVTGVCLWLKLVNISPQQKRTGTFGPVVSSTGNQISQDNKEQDNESGRQVLWGGGLPASCLQLRSIFRPCRGANPGSWHSSLVHRILVSSRGHGCMAVRATSGQSQEGWSQQSSHGSLSSLSSLWKMLIASHLSLSIQVVSKTWTWLGKVSRISLKGRHRTRDSLTKLAQTNTFLMFWNQRWTQPLTSSFLILCICLLGFTYYCCWG